MGRKIAAFDGCPVDSAWELRVHDALAYHWGLPSHETHPLLPQSGGKKGDFRVERVVYVEVWGYLDERPIRPPRAPMLIDYATRYERKRRLYRQRALPLVEFFRGDFKADGSLGVSVPAAIEAKLREVRYRDLPMDSLELPLLTAT